MKNILILSIFALYTSPLIGSIIKDSALSKSFTQMINTQLSSKSEMFPNGKIQLCNTPELKTFVDAKTSLTPTLLAHEQAYCQFQSAKIKAMNN